MSDLYLSLLILGSLVIVAVMIYNRVQEQRFRRRTERSFGAAQDDALLGPAPAPVRTEERIEPQFQASGEEEAVVASDRQEPRAAAPSPDRSAAIQPESPSSIDYEAQLRAREPVAAAQLKAFMTGVGPLMSRVHILGREGSAQPWTPVDLRAAVAPRELRLVLQLVDRRGTVGAQELAAFQSAAVAFAAALRADAVIPEPGPFVQRAEQLDRFCADVDVAVGINIIAPPGQPFSGARLRGQAEAAGFKWLEPAGLAYLDPDGRTVFMLESQGLGKLARDALRTQTTRSVTLLLDVPRQVEGVRVFDRMVSVGRSLSNALGGALVDDNSVPVSEAGLEQIRGQLRRIYAAMEAHGIPAGGVLALRLFS
jgi:FtsZ-interacting cell division protein ZipA